MLKNIIKKEGGFTLLELLIVIVIIGILALLIIPNITSAPKKARDTTRKTDIKAIQKGLEEYFVSNNNYPAALDELESGTPAIMKDVPQDPKQGTAPYTYTYTPTGTPASSYTLKACLENGGEQVAGDVLNDTSCTGSNRAFQVESAN